MWKFTLPALLTVLLILMACSGDAFRDSVQGMLVEGTPPRREPDVEVRVTRRMRAARNQENWAGPKQAGGSLPVWKFTLPALLTVLLILMACSGDA